MTITINKVKSESQANKQIMIKDLTVENKQLRTECELLRKEMQPMKQQMEQMEKTIEKQKMQATLNMEL